MKIPPNTTDTHSSRDTIATTLLKPGGRILHGRHFSVDCEIVDERREQHIHLKRKDRVDQVNVDLRQEQRRTREHDECQRDQRPRLRVPQNPRSSLMPQSEVQHPKVHECDRPNPYRKPADVNTLRQRKRPFGIVERIRDRVLKKHPPPDPPDLPHLGCIPYRPARSKKPRVPPAGL